MTDSKHPSPPSENRIEVVDCLRGIAVLSVCVSHFMAANCGLAADSFIRYVGTHGWLGVEIFFVISGFIIPYSLHRSGYQLSDYPKFLLKRVLRLDPPYLLAVLLAIVVGWLAAQSSAYRGAPYQVSIPQVLLHLAYVNTFFGYDWVNAVFWTLAIEFQYYLAVGLLLPLIAHHSLAVRVALGCGLGALAVLLPEGRFIFHWLFLFMLGMLAFHWHAKLAGRRELGFGLALLGGGAWFTLGPLQASVGVATALAIALVRLKARPLVFLGMISYSLYLIHVPIGAKLVNLGGRYVTGTLTSLALIAAALGVSILCAWALYFCVERPAQRWSSKVKYRASPSPD